MTKTIEERAEAQQWAEKVQKLEAEIERLRAQLAGLIEKGMDDLTMVAAFQVNEELRADNERLQAALKQFIAACDTAPTVSLMQEIGMACKAARRALEPKP